MHEPKPKLKIKSLILIGLFSLLSTSNIRGDRHIVIQTYGQIVVDILAIKLICDLVLNKMNHSLLVSNALVGAYY